jgi:hypothetical protein
MWKCGTSESTQGFGQGNRHQHLGRRSSKYRHCRPIGYGSHLFAESSESGFVQLCSTNQAVLGLGGIPCTCAASHRVGGTFHLYPPKQRDETLKTVIIRKLGLVVAEVAEAVSSNDRLCKLAARYGRPDRRCTAGRDAESRSDAESRRGGSNAPQEAGAVPDA